MAFAGGSDSKTVRINPAQRSGRQHSAGSKDLKVIGGNGHLAAATNRGLASIFKFKEECGGFIRPPAHTARVGECKNPPDLISDDPLNEVNHMDAYVGERTRPGKGQLMAPATRSCFMKGRITLNGNLPDSPDGTLPYIIRGSLKYSLES